MTGPVENGLYVFTYLHEVNNCKCVVAFIHLSKSNEEQMRGQQFISHAIPPTVIDLEAEATAVEKAVADGGVLIYKISWVEQA